MLADPPDVVVLAGRPLLFEPYIFSILHREGRWDASPLIRRICDGGVGLVVMDRPLESPSEELHGYAFWATPILAALRETMTLETEAAGRFIDGAGLKEKLAQVLPEFPPQLLLPPREQPVLEPK